MLVLTRKTGQKLLIGNNIEIKVLETHGESVKIGIEAPKDVPIYREELYLEIKRSNEQATQASSQKDSLDQALSQTKAIFEKPAHPNTPKQPL